MTRLFYPVSARAIGHWVRCTLLALRLSAAVACPTRYDRALAHQLDIEAVRWLDLHCQLNALAHCRSHRHAPAQH